MKMDEFASDEKLFKMLELYLYSKLRLLHCLYHLSCLQQNWSLGSFDAVFLLKKCFVSVNLPLGLAWNTVFISGLVLLTASVIG